MPGARWPFLVAALLCAGFATGLWTDWGGIAVGDHRPGDLGVGMSALCATAACLWSARPVRRRVRVGWLLLAAAQVALAAGLAAWNHPFGTPVAPIAEQWNSAGRLVTPGLLLAAQLLAVAGLILLVDRPLMPIGWCCRCLDGVIVAGSLVALSWSLTTIRDGAPPAGQVPHSALALAYPMLSLLAVGAVVGARLRSHGRNGARAINITLMVLACTAIADTLSAGPAAPEHLAGHIGRAVHFGWFAGGLLLACLPWIERRAARADPPKRTGRQNRGAHQDDTARRNRGRTADTSGPPALSPGAYCSAATPYLAAAVCGAALGWAVADRHVPDRITLLSCSGVLVALMIRQAVTLLQNVWLTRELADQESHFRSLVQGSSDVIMISGPDGRLRYVSPAARRVYGRTEDSLVGSRLRDLLHPDDRSQFLSAVRRFRSEGAEGAEGADGIEGAEQVQATRVECRIRSGDGSWLYVESTVDHYQDGLIFNSRDVTDRVRLQAQLQHNAFHDPLTDLPNRTLFAERARRALGDRRSSDGDGTVAVLYVDLDGFKAVNDASGHDVGDELLSQVARRLEQSVRAGDTVARLGGDEFAALICGDIEQQQMMEIAERLLEQLSRPYTVGGGEAAVTASIGIAFAEPGTSPVELLRNADLAMYRAKARGKARFEIYAPQLRADLLRRTVLDRRLRAAMEEGEFTLLYQPVTNLADGTTAGLEGHVRWRSARGALLTPAEFLRSPEAGDRAAELACWAVLRVVEEAHHHPALPVTVRVPTSVLDTADFGKRLGAALEETGMPPEHLLLEFTASGSAAELAARTGAVDRLRRTGVRIGLGGLGSGGSCLEALSRWPLSQLRLDSVLVRRLGDPSGFGVAPVEGWGRAPTIAAGLLGMAHGLGLLVVADGVNSAEQAATLRHFGCDRGQGMFFGGPVPEERLSALLGPEVLQGDGRWFEPERHALGSLRDPLNAPRFEADWELPGDGLRAGSGLGLGLDNGSVNGSSNGNSSTRLHGSRAVPAPRRPTTSFGAPVAVTASAASSAAEPPSRTDHRSDPRTAHAASSAPDGATRTGPYRTAPDDPSGPAAKTPPELGEGPSGRAGHAGCRHPHDETSVPRA